jgi:hypothetical protein
MRHNITNLDKAAVLVILFNNAKPNLVVFPDPVYVEELTLPKAQKIIRKRRHMYNPYNSGMNFDYLYDRILKVDLTRDEIDTTTYNALNGPNGADAALVVLRATVPEMEILRDDP